jgi:inosine/xanthosine triphosphatase
MKTVIVASTNPVKINAVKHAFKKMFSKENFKLIGISVPSGVPEQPIGDDETFNGAYNRAKNASKQIHKADYWVGLEGGIRRVDDDMEVFGWIVVKSKMKLGKSRTATFILPQKITQLVNKGMGLGPADDVVFKIKNSKQKQGSVGILTGGVTDRTKYLEDGVILALIPFKNTKLY